LTDASHTYGGDLSWSPSNDLAIVTGSAEGQQRVLRRVLTIAGNYIWNLTYGGGASGLVGTTATATQVEATMRAQMFQEACVTQNPPPLVTVNPFTNGLSVFIQYTDSETADPVILSFSVT
jgi:hypothetical protein